MNQCHFLGRLGADPEAKTVNGDKTVVNFRIAVDRKFKRGNDTAKETCWLDCEAWDSGAQLIAQYFKKGDPIIVHASIKQEEWDDKTTGQKRSKLKFRVNSFEFVPGNATRGEGGQDFAAEANTPKNGKARKGQNEDRDPVGSPLGSDDGDGDSIPF